MTVPHRQPRHRRGTPKTLAAITAALWLAHAFTAASWGQTGGDWLEQIETVGKGIFETYAPEQLRSEYELVSADELRQLLNRAQRVMYDGDMTELTALAPYLREGLTLVNRLPGAEGYAAWLATRLDFFEAAEELAPRQPPSTTGTPRPGGRRSFPPPPKPRPAGQPATMPEAIVHQPFWKARASKRPASQRANALVPQLKTAFTAKGIPPELVWLAEVESAFNPKARSPVGAVGLFQFMAPTAQRFGLKTAPADEREDPLKSAAAAASYLRLLHRQFHSWPLALAAYNAGEGRVARTLKEQGQKDFESIAPHLPTETRMYVPKVLGTIAAREKIDPTTLPPPR